MKVSELVRRMVEWRSIQSDGQGGIVGQIRR